MNAESIFYHFILFSVLCNSNFSNILSSYLYLVVPSVISIDLQLYIIIHVGQNVRFLANFLTEGGIIIKRSSVSLSAYSIYLVASQMVFYKFPLIITFQFILQTGISAKAQRKVAREIKTARAFGLMPFTTMGTKSFVFGRTMENLDEDYQYETFDNSMTADADEKDPFEG